MRIGTSATLAALFIIAHAQAQEPEIDWAGIAGRLDAVRAALDTHDIKKVSDAAEALSNLSVKEYLKTAPKAADRLRDVEAQIKTPQVRTLLLPQLATLAYDAGDMAKAEQYARETLLTPSSALDSNHAGNMVLGLVALKRQDIQAAKFYLLAAGRRRLPSRELPDMSLAKELIARGELTVVREYMEMCRDFITGDKSHINDWIALGSGRKPDLRTFSLHSRN